MRKNLETEGMWGWSCQAHCLNLLVGDMCKGPREKILQAATQVNKAFRCVPKKNQCANLLSIFHLRYVHALTEGLRKYHVPRPPQPGTTRWGTQRDVLLYHNRQWAWLAQVAAEVLKPNDPVRRCASQIKSRSHFVIICRHLENSQLSRGVLEFLVMVEPVVTALHLMQSACRTLGEAVEIWMELIERVPPGDSRKMVVERAGPILADGRALLCNIMNHRFGGQSLSDAQRALAADWVQNSLGSTMASQLDMYLARSGPFRPTLFAKPSAPDVWWTAGQTQGFPMELSGLGAKCARCRATTADLERAFSTAGNIFGRRRVSLGVERANRLTFVFQNLRRKCPVIKESDDEA